MPDLTIRPPGAEYGTFMARGLTAAIRRLEMTPVTQYVDITSYATYPQRSYVPGITQLTYDFRLDNPSPGPASFDLPGSWAYFTLGPDGSLLYRCLVRGVSWSFSPPCANVGGVNCGPPTCDRYSSRKDALTAAAFLLDPDGLPYFSDWLEDHGYVSSFLSKDPFSVLSPAPPKKAT